MFVITEAEAAAIRAAFDRGGEFAAAVGAAPAVPSYHRQSALYRPWIVRACRIRSIPAAVGPGLASAVHSAPAVRHCRRPADDPEQEALSLSCLPAVYD
jgi:hypothetical protein